MPGAGRWALNAGSQFANRAGIGEVLMYSEKNRADYEAGSELAEHPRTEEYSCRPSYHGQANQRDRGGNPEGVSRRPIHAPL
jgi:hypothetical protein